MHEDALVCRSCGNLRSVCSDPSIDHHPRTSVCWPTATREWAKRRLQETYKDEKPASVQLHPLDGLSVYTTEIPPPPDEDEFA